MTPEEEAQYLLENPKIAEMERQWKEEREQRDRTEAIYWNSLPKELKTLKAFEEYISKIEAQFNSQV